MAKKQRKSGGKRQQKDCPDLVRARTRWAAGDYNHALRLFEKAIRRQPNNLPGLADAARAFAGRLEASRAGAILNRIETLASRRPDELVLTAQSYRLARRPQAAIRCLENVLKQYPDHPAANFELAALLECKGDFGRAQACIARFRHADPASAAGKLAEARVLSHQDGAASIEPLLAELADPGVSPAIRAEALLLTAALREREGDYDEAFATMMESKEVLKRTSSAAQRNARTLEPVLLHLRSSVKSAHLKRWAKIPENPEVESPPLALMTGARCSGATLLARILGAHPSIAVADEVGAFSEHIFPTALLEGSEETSSRSSELFVGMGEATRRREALRYRRLLLENLDARPGDAPLQALVDKSASITALIPSFLRIIPQGRLLIPLRDPRDVLVSSLFSHLPLNRTTVAFLHPFDAVERVAFELETWVHFRAMIPAKRWIEVRYEDVVADFTSEARRVLEHLEVGWDEAVANYLTAPDQPIIHGQANVGVTQPIHRHAIGRWKNYEGQLAPYFKSLLPSLDALGYT